MYQVVSFYRTFMRTEGEYMGEPSVLWYFFVLMLGMLLVVAGTIYKEGGWAESPAG